MRLKHLDILCRKAFLADLPDGKLLINTINAFSYVNARKDALFAEALKNSDILIPDGISIVKACRFIESQPAERIAGWDLFVYEMERTNRKGGKVMFLGSSDNVLELIRKRVGVEYPNICVDTFSPPYKDCFDKEDDEKMINAVNQSNPDLLWIGMTAPKQEKWAYTHIDRLELSYRHDRSRLRFLRRHRKTCAGSLAESRIRMALPSRQRAPQDVAQVSAGKRAVPALYVRGENQGLRDVMLHVLSSNTFLRYLQISGLH